MLDLGRYFSCSHDLGFVTDARGSVLAATPGAERALGYTQSELKGVDLSTLDEGGISGASSNPPRPAPG